VLNNNLAGQMNEFSYTLPPENQLFSQNYLIQNEHDKSSIFQEKINSVIGYEIVFLALQKRE
jgi:hypothetical protein